MSQVRSQGRLRWPQGCFSAGIWRSQSISEGFREYKVVSRALIGYQGYFRESQERSNDSQGHFKGFKGISGRYLVISRPDSGSFRVYQNISGVLQVGPIGFQEYTWGSQGHFRGIQGFLEAFKSVPRSLR